MAFRVGRIYYGEKYAVVQVDGKATAVVSELTWHADGSVDLSNARTFLSLFDAMSTAALDGDADFEEALASGLQEYASTIPNV